MLGTVMLKLTDSIDGLSNQFQIRKNYERLIKNEVRRAQSTADANRRALNFADARLNSHLERLEEVEKKLGLFDKKKPKQKTKKRTLIVREFIIEAPHQDTIPNVPKEPEKAN